MKDACRSQSDEGRSGIHTHTNGRRTKPMRQTNRKRKGGREGHSTQGGKVGGNTRYKSRNGNDKYGRNTFGRENKDKKEEERRKKKMSKKVR